MVITYGQSRRENTLKKILIQPFLKQNKFQPNHWKTEKQIYATPAPIILPSIKAETLASREIFSVETFSSKMEDII